MGKKRIIFSTGLSAISKTKYLKIEYFVISTFSDKTLFIYKKYENFLATMKIMQNNFQNTVFPRTEP